MSTAGGSDPHSASIRRKQACRNWHMGYAFIKFRIIFFLTPTLHLKFQNKPGSVVPFNLYASVNLFREQAD